MAPPAVASPSDPLGALAARFVRTSQLKGIGGILSLGMGALMLKLVLKDDSEGGKSLGWLLMGAFIVGGLVLLEQWVTSRMRVTHLVEMLHSDSRGIGRIYLARSMRTAKGGAMLVPVPAPEAEHVATFEGGLSIIVELAEAGDLAKLLARDRFVAGVTKAEAIPTLSYLRKLSPSTGQSPPQPGPSALVPAHGSGGPSNPDKPAPMPAKRSWERTVDGKPYWVRVTASHVVLGEGYARESTEATVSHDDFLRGGHQDTIRADFSQEVLDEVSRAIGEMRR